MLNVKEEFGNTVGEFLSAVSAPGSFARTISSSIKRRVRFSSLRTTSVSSNLIEFILNVVCENYQFWQVNRAIVLDNIHACAARIATVRIM